jgi:hypothetical protein
MEWMILWVLHLYEGVLHLYEGTSGVNMREITWAWFSSNLVLDAVHSQPQTAFREALVFSVLSLEASGQNLCQSFVWTHVLPTTIFSAKLCAMIVNLNYGAVYVRSIYRGI